MAVLFEYSFKLYMDFIRIVCFCFFFRLLEMSKFCLYHLVFITRLLIPNKVSSDSRAYRDLVHEWTCKWKVEPCNKPNRIKQFSDSYTNRIEPKQWEEWLHTVLNCARSCNSSVHQIVWLLLLCCAEWADSPVRLNSWVISRCPV